MIIILIILLFASTKIDDFSVSKYVNLLVSFAGVVFTTLTNFYTYDYIPSIFRCSTAISYALTYIWLIFFIKIIFDIQQKKQIEYDLKHFVLINLMLINSIPLAILCILLWRLFILDKGELIDYGKGKVHFYGLYIWIFVHFFYDDIPPLLLNNSYYLVTTTFVLGSIIYLFRSNLFKGVSYLIPIFFVLREDLVARKINGPIIEFTVLAILFLIVWTVWFTKLDEKIIPFIVNKKYISKIFLKLKIYNDSYKYNDYIRLVVTRPKHKYINKQGNELPVATENSIRFNAIFIIIAANIAIILFYIGLLK